MRHKQVLRAPGAQRGPPVTHAEFGGAIPFPTPSLIPFTPSPPSIFSLSLPAPIAPPYPLSPLRPCPLAKTDGGSGAGGRTSGGSSDHDNAQRRPGPSRAWVGEGRGGAARGCAVRHGQATVCCCAPNRGLRRLPAAFKIMKLIRVCAGAMMGFGCRTLGSFGGHDSGMNATCSRTESLVPKFHFGPVLSKARIVATSPPEKLA